MMTSSGQSQPQPQPQSPSHLQGHQGHHQHYVNQYYVWFLLSIGLVILNLRLLHMPDSSSLGQQQDHNTNPKYDAPQQIVVYENQTVTVTVEVEKDCPPLPVQVAAVPVPVAVTQYESKKSTSTSTSTLQTSLLQLWESLPIPEDLNLQNMNNIENSNETSSHLILSNLIQPKILPPNQTEQVTMVTHASANKLDNLLVQLRWWQGPSVAALYLKSVADIETFCRFVETDDSNNSIMIVLQNTTIHIMMEKTLEETKNTKYALGYPHNMLRNLVLDHLKSDYFVAMDADFIPSQGAHEGLYNLIHSDNRIKWRLQHRWVYVLPAFELKFSQLENGTWIPPTQDMLPTNKQDVRQRVQNGTMMQFHVETGRMAHRPTNFDKWTFGDNHNFIDEDVFYNINYSGTFEPYVLGYRPGMPRYVNDFRGFAYNKMSWFMELDAAGYLFSVLTEYWVVHMNHWVKRKQTHVDSARNRPYYRKFKSYLTSHYNTKNEPKEKKERVPPKPKKNKAPIKQQQQQQPKQQLSKTRALLQEARKSATTAQK